MINCVVQLVTTPILPTFYWLLLNWILLNQLRIYYWIHREGISNEIIIHILNWLLFPLLSLELTYEYSSRSVWLWFFLLKSPNGRQFLIYNRNIFLRGWLTRLSDHKRLLNIINLKCRLILLILIPIIHVFVFEFLILHYLLELPFNHPVVRFLIKFQVLTVLDDCHKFLRIPFAESLSGRR